MSLALRSPVPISSAAELSVWWAEVLSEPDAPGRALSLQWLDPAGCRIGRVLSISGIAAQPDPKVIGFVRQLRDMMVSESDTPAHVALALSRSGRSSATRADREWATVLKTAFDADDQVSWSLHVATDRWITTVVEPPAEKFDARRIARRPPSMLLDRHWLVDQD